MIRGNNLLFIFLNISFYHFLLVENKLQLDDIPLCLGKKGEGIREEYILQQYYQGLSGIQRWLGSGVH